jgi:hypothetical protein
MEGSLRGVYESWRDELRICLAHTEAVIDFGEDEHDVTDSAYDAIRPRVTALRAEMAAHLADGRRGEIIRSGERHRLRRCAMSRVREVSQGYRAISSYSNSSATGSYARSRERRTPGAYGRQSFHRLES